MGVAAGWERGHTKMTPPFVAFTSLDRQEWVCVGRSEENENRLSLSQRARGSIEEVAHVVPGMLNRLLDNLEVMPIYRATQRPYLRYFDTVLDLKWIQAHADASRRQRR